MRDDLIQPAFAIFNSPRVYALLLGSGVSRSAEILTGDQIIVDLINQVAAALDEVIEGDAKAWYAKRFEKPAGYDALLEELGRTRLDRNSILRDYFEPNEEDREAGRKLPTQAHKSIAWLVKKGYIRVIVTTNFDRLIETALEAEGIVADIISTEDDLSIAKPLQHSKITVIKVHGDYRDERIKNTEQELREYTPEMTALLQRVFSEYGLIVCGWSGDWDIALRNILENSSARYAKYWSYYSELTTIASDLVQKCNAHLIHHVGADEFFSELHQMIEALEGTKKEPPLSVAVAVERVKKLLPREESQNELRDFLNQQIELGFDAFSNSDFRRKLTTCAKEDTIDIDCMWDLYFKQLEIPISVFSTLCLYGKGKQTNLIEDAVNRWSEEPIDAEERDHIYRYFPSLLLIYGCGIGATFTQSWEYFNSILLQPRIVRRSGGKSIVESVLLNISRTFDSYASHRKISAKNSTHIYKKIRSIFLRYSRSDERFDYNFDLFEMLLILSYMHKWKTTYRTPVTQLPVHCVPMERRSWELLKDFWYEGGISGKGWGLLRNGLFEGNPSILLETLEEYIALVNQIDERRVFRDFPNFAEIYGNRG